MDLSRIATTYRIKQAKTKKHDGEVTLIFDDIHNLIAPSAK